MAEHLNQMRGLASEILATPAEQISWFRYGATYVLSLLRLMEFYRVAGREEEAYDVATELREKLASADTPQTIAKNLLRIGFYLDEAERVKAAEYDGASPEVLLDIIRTPK